MSDDEAPALHAGKGAVNAFDWLAARGVSKAAAEAWYLARYRAGLEPERANLLTSLGYTSCRELVVGERGEPAIACEYEIPFDIAQRRGVVVVVRATQPVAVIDVGLGLFAYDFPDVRHLDLALHVGDDGRHAELRDRAPTGTLLVETQASCRVRLDREGGPIPNSTLPSRLVACDAARESLAAMVRDAKGSPREQAEPTRALAFADKSCKERGRWTWKGAGFVR